MLNSCDAVEETPAQDRIRPLLLVATCGVTCCLNGSSLSRLACWQGSGENMLVYTLHQSIHICQKRIATPSIIQGLILAGAPNRFSLCLGVRVSWQQKHPSHQKI